MILRKVQVRLDPIAFGPVLSQALDAVRPTAEAKGIDLRCEWAASDLMVLGDAERLLQVLHNLLGNAVKFTPGGGAVTVRMCVEEGALVLEVEDTGIGIAPDLLPHIFDQFTQGAGRAPDRSRGLGLGLAIAHHLIEGTGRDEAASAARARVTPFTGASRAQVTQPGRPRCRSQLRPCGNPDALVDAASRPTVIAVFNASSDRWTSSAGCGAGRLETGVGIFRRSSRRLTSSPSSAHAPRDGRVSPPTGDWFFSCFAARSGLRQAFVITTTNKRRSTRVRGTEASRSSASHTTAAVPDAGVQAAPTHTRLFGGIMAKQLDRKLSEAGAAGAAALAVPTASATGPDKPKRGGTLTIGRNHDADTLYPGRSTGCRPSRPISCSTTASCCTTFR